MRLQAALDRNCLARDRDREARTDSCSKKRTEYVSEKNRTNITVATGKQKERTLLLVRNNHLLDLDKILLGLIELALELLESFLVSAFLLFGLGKIGLEFGNSVRLKQQKRTMSRVRETFRMRRSTGSRTCCLAAAMRRSSNWIRTVDS
jgi:hypothetical protein